MSRSIYDLICDCLQHYNTYTKTSKSKLLLFDLLWICCRAVKVIKATKILQQNEQIHNKSYKWRLDFTSRCLSVPQTRAVIAIKKRLAQQL